MQGGKGIEAREHERSFNVTLVWMADLLVTPYLTDGWVGYQNNRSHQFLGRCPLMLENATVGNNVIPNVFPTYPPRTEP